MKYPKMVRWMIKEKRWAKTGQKFETKVTNEDEFNYVKDLIKSDTKMQLIMVEDILEINEEKQ